VGFLRLHIEILLLFYPGLRPNRIRSQEKIGKKTCQDCQWESIGRSEMQWKGNGQKGLQYFTQCAGGVAMRERFQKLRAKWTMRRDRRPRFRTVLGPFPKLSQHIVLNSKVVGEDESE